MKVELAKYAGFCYGVNRAVELAEETGKKGIPCYMLGPLIHNAHVTAKLEAMGLKRVDRVEEVPEGATVLIRSHGEKKAVYDALKAKGATILDATCPSVARIHKIVAEAERRGRKPLIIGTQGHPEVEAIAGWCAQPEIFGNAEELGAWMALQGEEIPVAMVSQTTLTQEIWKECVQKIKKEWTNAEIFDTICNATFRRQSEAMDLAGRCDGMIVIGDRHSGNTKRLVELCRSRCDRVLPIEDAAELDPSFFEGAAFIGITAGASTPGWIIKEVRKNMNEEIMEIEESFADLLEKSIKTLHTGEKVTGVVVNVGNTEIEVDLGTKHAGYISQSEMTDDPNAKLADLVKVGDEIEAFVGRVNDQEGIVTLSKKRLDTVKSWEEVENAVESKAVLEGVVTEENKGGVVVSVKGVRVFVTASQTGLPREAEMSVLLKQHVKLRITEVNRARRRVVGSIRAVEAEERAAKAAAVWSGIEEGKRYTGTVKSLTSYGAFVDIGGVDGMVHISELSWSRIKHPSEVVNVGDTVEVFVLSFDSEKQKISLGMKDKTQDPWAIFTDKYQVGDVANVRVVKLMTFGAFAEIVPGVDGLIHISQIADHRIEKPGDVLAEGDMVDVKITDIDMEKQKVSLSIRALSETVEVEEDEDSIEE